MDMTCSQCNQQNPAEAEFCGRCGAALRRVGPHPRFNPVAGFALVGAAALSLMTAATAVQSAWAPPSPSPRHISVELLDREYALSFSKSDQLFHMLKPDDIQVVVRRQDGGIGITGTQWEVDVLDRFVELINRKHDQDKATVLRYIDRSLKTSDTQERYRLPSHERNALFKILQADDVPVLVDNSWGGVGVQATAEDQETIREVAEILRGRRRGCGGIRCFLGYHSSDCATQHGKRQSTSPPLNRFEVTTPGGHGVVHIEPPPKPHGRRP